MRNSFVALAAALACYAAFAQQGDRTQSPACRKALDALQAQEAAAAAASAPQGRAQQRATRARLQALQRDAATACLGGSRAKRRMPAGATMQPPISVPPVSVGPQPAMPPAAPPSLAVPTQAPLVTLTACDAAGCLASDGTRLQWVGPNLLGPRGLCTVQGVTLQCPNP